MIKSVLGRASPLTKRYFLSRLGLDGYLKQAQGVLAHFREPGPANYNPHTNEMSETELMDEDAHELQTHVVNNPYDLEIFGGDITTARNFGTVDNPVLVFSANVGWRYVQCHGMHDEEEGHSHSQVWFVLREGPIHRCHACGQCFKLINLPDAITPESDYYQEHFMPINEDDFGDDEDWMQRWTFHNYTKPYPTLYPHQNTFRAYMLVNNDEHDRILTDPAYRMQKLHQGHQIADAQHRAMMDIEDRWRLENLGKFPKSQYTRQDYEDLVTSELAIRRLDRVFSKIQLFNKRQFLDFENHERREKRMQERAKNRESQIEILPEVDEAEQRFRDYYETDYDSECEQQNDLNDFEEIQQSQLLNFDSFRFVEEGSVFPKEGVVSVFDKKSFRFKHRIWNDPTHVYLARQKRMISRFLQRKVNAPKLDLNLIGQAIQKQGFQKAIEQAMPYRNWLVEEAIQQYKDYYESDTEDLEDFKYMSLEERLSFARNFVDYSVTDQKQNQNLTMVGDYSQSLFGGFWSNLKHLLPQAKKVAQEKVQEEFKQGDLTYEKFIEDLKNFELKKTSEPEKIE